MAHYSSSLKSSARLAIGGGIAALALLLSACGAATTTVNTPAGPTATATTPPLVTAALASSSDVNTICNGALRPGGGSATVYQYGDLYAEPALALAYPSYAMPTGAASKPFDLGASLNGSDVDTKFGGAPNLNPKFTDKGAIIFTICNNGQTAVTLNSIGVGILSFTPHASPVDSWQLCDGAYQAGQVISGCGGASADDLTVGASLPANATTGATATASMVSVDNYTGNTYTALPTQVAPNATIMIAVEIVAPTTPGVYTFGITLSATGNTSNQYAALPPELFAQVAHSWSGDACKDPSQTSQIPSGSQDYWICPVA